MNIIEYTEYTEFEYKFRIVHLKCKNNSFNSYPKV